MKVIGKTAENNGDYIAIVTHAELQQLQDRFYKGEPLKVLKMGDTMNLGLGYDFRRDIQDSCAQMERASKAFGTAQATLLKFAVMVGQLPEAQADQVRNETTS